MTQDASDFNPTPGGFVGDGYDRGHEDCLVWDEAGLRKLIESCETALEHGDCETPWADFHHVVLVDAEVPRDGPAPSQSWRVRSSHWVA